MKRSRASICPEALSPMKMTSSLWYMLTPWLLDTTRFVDIPRTCASDMLGEYRQLSAWRRDSLCRDPPVMEHGLYVLEGKAVYPAEARLVKLDAGDYMWLRAFLPQALLRRGPGPVPAILLYKDVKPAYDFRPTAVKGMPG